MHWLNPPNPAEYPSPGLGLLVALFAIVLIFVVVVLHVTKSGPLLPEREPDPDETPSTNHQQYKGRHEL